MVKLIEKIIEWFNPKTKLRIRDSVPWPETSVRLAIEVCMAPFYWPAIENHGIVVAMDPRPAARDDAAGASNGYYVVLDTDLTEVPLSETALAHELEHIRQFMLGNERWREHTNEFLSHVAAKNAELQRLGL